MNNCLPPPAPHSSYYRLAFAMSKDLKCQFSQYSSIVDLLPFHFIHSHAAAPVTLVLVLFPLASTDSCSCATGAV